MIRLKRRNWVKDGQIKRKKKKNPIIKMIRSKKRKWVKDGQLKRKQEEEIRQ